LNSNYGDKAKKNALNSNYGDKAKKNALNSRKTRPGRFKRKPARNYMNVFFVGLQWATVGYIYLDFTWNGKTEAAF
jgi:hypothetical protein